MVPLRVVVCFAVIAVAVATTRVEKCRVSEGKKEEKEVKDLNDKVSLSCKGTPCILKKGSETHISINFTPDQDVANVDNKVSAELFGVPLPFIGVDGTTICNKIFLENGDKATCPLQAGTKYVYKDSFPILNVYPQTALTVHWALTDRKRDLFCFEVAARIK